MFRGRRAASATLRRPSSPEMPTLRYRPGDPFQLGSVVGLLFDRNFFGSPQWSRGVVIDPLPVSAEFEKRPETFQFLPCGRRLQIPPFTEASKIIGCQFRDRDAAERINQSAFQELEFPHRVGRQTAGIEVGNEPLGRGLEGKVVPFAGNLPISRPFRCRFPTR